MALRTSWLIWRAGRIKPAERVTLGDVLHRHGVYGGLIEGYTRLSLPAAIRIKGKYYPVPLTLKQFSSRLCYGQRLFLVEREAHDIGIALRYLDGYYYTMVTGEPWDAERALSFGRYILNCTAKDVFPITQHLVKLMDELITREKKHLFREPSKLEKAAGIERLNRFANLTALMFLMQSFNLTEAAVMQLPYDDCLVRFMLQKEQQAFNERLAELRNKELNKGKYHDKG